MQYLNYTYRWLYCALVSIAIFVLGFYFDTSFLLSEYQGLRLKKNFLKNRVNKKEMENQQRDKQTITITDNHKMQSLLYSSHFNELLFLIRNSGLILKKITPIPDKKEAMAEGIILQAVLNGEYRQINYFIDQLYQSKQITVIELENQLYERGKIQLTLKLYLLQRYKLITEMYRIHQSDNPFCINASFLFNKNRRIVPLNLAAGHVCKVGETYDGKVTKIIAQNAKKELFVINNAGLPSCNEP